MFEGLGIKGLSIKCLGFCDFFGGLGSGFLGFRDEDLRFWV